jgi:hypothetical protein
MRRKQKNLSTVGSAKTAAIIRAIDSFTESDKMKLMKTLAESDKSAEMKLIYSTYKAFIIWGRSLKSKKNNPKLLAEYDISGTSDFLKDMLVACERWVRRLLKVKNASASAEISLKD